MKTSRNHIWLLLPVLILAAGSVFAKQHNVTECGTFLTEPGKYKLVNDLLDCPGPVDGIVILGSDITLDLKGHEITCAGDTFIGGVVVVGTPEAVVRNVTVKNGHVSNCFDGIVILMTEDSKITKISSTGNHMWKEDYGTGITMWMTSNIVIRENYLFDNEGHGIVSWISRNNVFMKNHIFGNGGAGIMSWLGDGNLFKHNTSADNVDGFGIWANIETNSRFLCNRTYSNDIGIGIGPDSSGNLVRGNYASGNLWGGITVTGLKEDGELLGEFPAGNTVRSNIAEENGYFDLSEIFHDVVTGENSLHPDGTCFNTWEKNQFGTQFAPDGCIGFPVELDDDDVCALDDDD